MRLKAHRLHIMLLLDVVLAASALMAIPQLSFAQQMGTAVSTFLEFPVSAHTAALGGNVTSFYGTDPMFAFNNPALLKSEAYNQLHLNYSVYMYNTGYGSAAYTFKASDKDAFMVGFQGAHYGNMDSYDATGARIGTVSANDFALTATYSRWINRYFSIGVTLKPVINSYGSYTSFSLGSDIGVMFHDSASLVNLALTVQNLGGRLAGPEDIVMTSKWMPLNVSIGLTKRLKKAPLAFNLTLQKLQQWDNNYATNYTTTDAGKENVGIMIGRKFIIGMDIMPFSEKFWIGLSYNFDRGLSLDNPTVLSLAGLSLGGGAKLYMFKLGIGVAFYSTASVTANFSLAMDVNWFAQNKKTKL